MKISNYNGNTLKGNYYLDKNDLSVYSIDKIGNQRLLSQPKNGGGYKRVKLDGGYKMIHRVIYETIVGEYDFNKIIDHIDGNRLNNNVKNLRAVTQFENMHNIHTNPKKRISRLQKERDRKAQRIDEIDGEIARLEKLLNA